MMNAVGLGIKNLSHEGDYTTPTYVCGYVRCSTAHEAQLEAIEAQEQWLRDYISLRPNWILTEIYIDRGVTGTVETRPEFQRMLEDAKRRKFTLICSRELCRFSRNVLHTIQVTRELSERGIECFFISDNIWTMSNEGELKLNLMATLSQEESRRCAQRVYHGLESVRSRKTVMGNGNCFALRLCRGTHAVDNRYEIIPEEAETVKFIYDAYLNKGMGIKAISRELIRQNRTNASGKVEWDPTRVKRILRNRTYAGFIGYNKSNTINYLKHNRKNNSDWRTHEYVYSDGKIPVIISDEQWQKAQELLDSRTAEFNGKRRGVNPARNVWLTKLRCSCGTHSHYKRYHWRTNSNVRTGGEPTQVYGYACANVVNNGGKELRREYGVEGGCSVKSFPEWKLVFMTQILCSRLLKNPSKTKDKMIALIRKYYEPMNQPVFVTKEVYEKDLNKTERRLKSLFEMRMDGSISADEFKENKKQLDEEKDRLISKIDEIERANDIVAKNEDMEGQILEISEMLDTILSFEGSDVSEDLVKVLISKIVPCPGYVFKFYLNLRGNQGGEPVLCDSFHITYEQASEYRKKCGTYVRKNQWPTDLLVEVYV